MEEPKISFQLIFIYYQEYLETLSDNDDDEAYQSSRSFAQWQVGEFLIWLYKNKFQKNNDLPKFALEKALNDFNDLLKPTGKRNSTLSYSTEFELINGLFGDLAHSKVGIQKIKNLIVEEKNKQNKKEQKIHKIII